MFAKLDARWFQILFLASFLTIGALARDFALSWQQVALCFASGILTQTCWQHALRLPGRYNFGGYLSALISCFGISILVRADNLWVHPLLACIAMSSKYLLRAGPAACKSHILNPANLAAFLALSVVEGAWLSPGQWGSSSLLALWFIALGGIVTQRIARLDVSITFLLVWGGVLAARLLWLGYAWDPGAAIWVKQFCNGATLLFAFFMISDPMTTPQRRSVRMLWVAAVALAAYYWQFMLFKQHGLIVALFALSWLVPLLNWLWPQTRFEWRETPPQTSPLSAAPATMPQTRPA
ncbi:RnfABCDGE type electron transport complex subunit D [Massilia sp. W12]|uniref:RnfABCDGE type electron transport complex subunit D n=1 Tax=Massilia sp. W12 TaxID=3126507 RepID=UPI0030CD0882